MWMRKAIALHQFAEQSGDFVASRLPADHGGDERVDPVSLTTAIDNNFPAPPGAKIFLLGISSSQTSVVHS